ncbi:MAG TPA: DoxX family protein [Fimbriimonadaceae bacterium]|nr:DoxX family protein [Fimbriimonadaceae bacterium]
MGTHALSNIWSPRLLGLLRIVSGFMLMQHGAQKLFGVLDAPHGAAPIFSQMGLGGIIEFFGGLLILVGLLTRPVAFLLSGTMAVAYFQFHAPNGFWPVVNQGELAAIYSFLFLYMTAAGAGAWSVDSILKTRKALETEPVAA